jgi:non-specific serine/threonine protein kinase
MGPLAVGRDGRLVAARDALGRRDFDRHLARGAALDLSEVLRYAEDDVLPGQPKPNPATSLTSRELAVAELVARGMSNRDIAAVLVISVHTVQGHVEKILRKLGFGSRAQVAAWVAHRSLETAR